MTVSEAIDKGIGFIRKPEWNQHARLELVKAADGTQGPWTTLHDIDPAADEQADGQIPIQAIDILLSHADDGEGDWEEWVSPAPRPAPSSQ